MRNIRRIALLTAGHLSSCPRLLKEAELLSSNGYSISIVYLNSISTLADLDYDIIRQHADWEFNEVKWKNSFEKIISQLYYKLSNVFNRKSIFIQSTSKILIDKTIKIKADLYIAHHPTVLVAASLAAAKYNSLYAYDIEDAFPYVEDGRYVDNPNTQILDLEKKYITNTIFTTVASPLYSELYIKLYNLKKTPVNIFNVFKIADSEIEFRDRIDFNKVSLYWYSQTVGLKRGLQDLFMAINYLDEDSFELHVRGDCTSEVKHHLLSLVKSEKLRTNVFFHPQVSIDELSLRNKEHDIGFALETNTSLNRDLCISNKIFDYLRSGLMIVATNTKGHSLVTKELKGNCITYNERDVDTLSEQLSYYIQNRQLINEAKTKSLKLAKEKYSWEKQSLVYLEACINACN